MVPLRQPEVRTLKEAFVHKTRFASPLPGPGSRRHAPRRHLPFRAPIPVRPTLTPCGTPTVGSLKRH